jgi:hypothetical protein
LGGLRFSTIPDHRLAFQVSTGRTGSRGTVTPNKAGLRLAADWLKSKGSEVAAA